MTSPLSIIGRYNFHVAFMHTHDINDYEKAYTFISGQGSLLHVFIDTLSFSSRHVYLEALPDKNTKLDFMDLISYNTELDKVTKAYKEKEKTVEIMLIEIKDYLAILILMKKEVKSYN